MFKSTFAKYLTVFIFILIVSFVILSSIITTAIRTYVAESKESILLRTCSALSSQMQKMGIEDIYDIASLARSLDDAMSNASGYLSDIAKRFVKEVRG